MKLILRLLYAIILPAVLGVGIGVAATKIPTTRLMLMPAKCIPCTEATP